MKLGVVNHVRCGEDTFKSTLVWLPDDMTDDQFAAAINEARTAYLVFVRQFNDAPNEYRPHNPTPYRQHPTLTVAEVDAEWAVKKAAWEAWDKDLRKRGRHSARISKGGTG